MKKTIFLLITGLFLLVSCGGSNNADIINPDAEYLYFYGATCPHCQELNKRVKDEDLFSTITVEKREVYYNNENRDLFLETAKELGLEEGKVWVPFVLHKQSGQFSIGTDGALELFKKDFTDILEAQATESAEAENTVEIPAENIPASEETTENSTWSISE